MVRNRAAYMRQWKRKNPEKVNATNARYRANNPGLNARYIKASRERNPAVDNASRVKYRQTHQANRKANGAYRRAMKFHQTCNCCTREDVQQLFTLAHMISGHVDHIVPLALGGHHCGKNLQVLTVAAHREKTRRDLGVIALARLRNRLLHAWR
jgi:5-methylcytosine-specific restriction endonuclease McrA